MTLYKFGFPPGFPPGQGLRAAQARPAPILPSARAAAGTATAATRQCPAFTEARPPQAAASRPRAAPPATLGPEENSSGGHLRPSWPDAAPPAPWPGVEGTWLLDPGAGSHSERRTRRPLRVEGGAVPLRRASSRAEERVGRPRRGGSDIRATGLATTTAPSGSSQPLWTPGQRLARGNRCRGVEGRASSPRKPPAPVSSPPPAPTSRSPELGRRARHAGHGRLPRGSRASRARVGPGPTSCACTGAGRRAGRPISAARPGTAPESPRGAGGRTSWGARRGRLAGYQECEPAREPDTEPTGLTWQLRGSEREGAAGRGAGGA